ncbi:conjugal transfer protein TraE [Actinobacillus delphinicola]|uniref:type IA DNA topoisomerase n=1 Tax=Actinobacillus delphinicola TaxID=51161 RepID=UPI002441AB2A|nr:DNA topoisomerase 3 [Actinobacillus delphinicola]MDG6896485.1 conjugal transfer protein TraE [Actinobacillus delphinicola]
MKLVIAEKPQLGTVIAEALGIISRKNGYIECKNSYIVTWAIGHILELQKPQEYNPAYAQWNKADLPLKLRPLQLTPKENTLEQFKVVESLLQQADTVINAGDPDDEGQLLVDEVIDYCNFTGKVKRVLINDLNVESAKKAMENLQDNANFIGMRNKALARSQADFIYGINMTRAYTLAARQKGLTGVYSVGRVQTPTLGLIVNRYLANKAHKESFYYNVTGVFEDITAKLVITDNIKADPNDEDKKEKRIIDEKVCLDIKAQCENQPFFIKSLDVQSKSTPAPLPFALLDLQAKINNKYGFSSDETLKITQSLREKHKAITYNRSDCRYLSEEQFQDAPQTLDFLSSLFPELPFDNADRSQKSRAFNDQKVTAHTGIIPVKASFSLSDLTDKERKVYEEIVKQYLVQFLPNKLYDSATVTLKEKNYGYLFKANAIKITDHGWTKLVADEEEQENVEAGIFEKITAVENGEQKTCQKINIKKEKTKPLPIYTEATLLKDLQRVAKYIDDPNLKKLLIEKDKGREGENGGIGTPATRSAIIKNLNEKGYFEYKGKQLIPTQKGIDFIKALPKIITVPDTTALWFEQQIEIENGNMSVEEFLNGIDEFVTTQIKLSDDINLEVKGEPCPKCKKGMIVERKSKVGDKFFSCTNYPECNYIVSTLNGDPIPNCPICGNNLHKNKMAINCKSENCLTVWLTVASKNLSESQVYTLLTKGKTGLIKGFTSKTGKSFDAKLILDKANKKVSFEFCNK